ncbi:hypothetical protein E1161_00770 [Saccharopolyspora aridisoli]|uniref:Uncharacterized protein n=1 Tax=Saccharopolyspora aridisoli TaxID=2530385 RepID=A0A4R4UX49_9PSEU|nr:hypothetical protein [Saccharopolyspora aridisoli]TDC96791.1 hypothetical protein E1161_00770 [Saccharopolyspora aridisoli]
MTETTRITAPGLVIGTVAGLFTALFTLVAGGPPAWAVTAGLMLAVPLAAFGAGCSALRLRGVLRGGAFAPVALYWLIAFPLARLVQEVGTRLAVGDSFSLPPQPVSFLIYQALISVGFAIGFVWVQERLVRGGAGR